LPLIKNADFSYTKNYLIAKSLRKFQNIYEHLQKGLFQPFSQGCEWLFGKFGRAFSVVRYLFALGGCIVIIPHT